MMKAATAADIHHFVLNYQANASQLKNNGTGKTSSFSSSFATGIDRKSGNNVESKQLLSNMHPDHIPVALILQYLHDYSNGLVSGP